VSLPERRATLVALALFAGAALISGFTILRGIDPFDEGLALQAADRVADGQMPYADFTWAYGPGTPYLLGLFRELFGASLLDWRILRVLVDAGIAVTVFWLVRRETGSVPFAVGGWLLAACALADPRSANPFSYALLAVLLAFGLATGTRPRPLPAGALLAVAAAFRIDFALFGLAAMLVAAKGTRTRVALACAVGAFVVYLPFLIAVGPADLYDALIGTSLRESDYWSLPFPLDYDGSASDLEHLLEFYVPLLLVVGALGAAVALALRWRSERRVEWTAAGLVVLAAGFGLYLRSRADPFHAQPLAVVLAVVIPVAVMAVRMRVATIALTMILALVLLDAAGDRGHSLLSPEPLSPVDVPAADGVEAPPSEASALERTVALVDSLVPAGDPIYVLPRRSDLVKITAPLLYVLTDRPNPTPRDHGLLTGEAEQRGIVGTLERVRPRAIVRWTDPLSSEPEDNLRGRSSGVTLVDDWVAAHYALRQRAGYYEVLVPR
jgi:hypothetical protein